MIIKWIEAVLVAACCAVGGRHYLHMLQLESYQLAGYQRYLKRNVDRMFRSLILVGVLFTVLFGAGVSCCLANFPVISGGVSIIISTIVAAALGALLFPRKEAVPDE